jgi:hypothetical protein
MTMSDHVPNDHSNVTLGLDNTGDGSSHFHDESGLQKYDLHGAGPREYDKTWPETVTDVPGIGRVKQGN